MLSKSCVYGLRAVIYIVSTKKDSFVSIRKISEKLDISFYFLTKILQILTQKNILVSFKGPNGGIKLAKPADQVTLMEIVLALDGAKVF
jgi:Rrf2 family protein